MNPRGARLAAIVLLAIAAVAFVVAMKHEGASGPPSRRPALEDGDLGGVGPVIVPERRSTDAAAPAERAGASAGEVAAVAQELRVHVDRGSSTVPALAVDLLFGSQLEAQPKAMRLAIDGGGRATLPLGVGAALPFRAEFAFPTLGRSGVAIAFGVDGGAGHEIELTLPPCGVLEFEVVEVDGSPVAGSVVLEVRNAVAPWPANRWLRVPIEHGRGSCPAAIGDHELEVSVNAASGRGFEGRMAAPRTAEERVLLRVELAARPGIVFELVGLPVGEVAAEGWRVGASFAAAEVLLSAHGVPGMPGCFVVHPLPEVIRVGWTDVLVTVRSRADGQTWVGNLRIDPAGSIDLVDPLPVVVEPLVFSSGR